MEGTLLVKEVLSSGQITFLPVDAFEGVTYVGQRRGERFFTCW